MGAGQLHLRKRDTRPTGVVGRTRVTISPPNVLPQPVERVPHNANHRIVLEQNFGSPVNARKDTHIDAIGGLGVDVSVAEAHSQHPCQFCKGINKLYNGLFFDEHKIRIR